MRIVILNQFFYPDHSATSQLMTELAISLAERGVTVTAVSGRGRYLGGERLAARETHQGVRIERAWSTAFGKGSVVRRLADYFTFFASALLKLLTLERHDVVMSLTTPPLIGVVGMIAAWLRGMRTIALVQDVYPDVAIALGAIRRGSIAARLLNLISRAVLRAADRIVVLGECMRERVAANVGPRDARRIEVIHNWADGDSIRPITKSENTLVAEWGLGKKFVVMFSGNLGLVNDFWTVLDSARRLRKHEDIVFLFAGDGGRVAAIQSYKQEHELANIWLLPYQPRELLGKSLCVADIHLVTLADGLAGLSVPSKTSTAMATGRPVFFVGDLGSDTARIVGESCCGQVFPSGESEWLAAAIARLSREKGETEVLGKNARAVFERRFDRSLAVTAYLKVIEGCIPAARLSVSEEQVTIGERAG